MPLPTFLIIGAIRCGTTSLQHYLSQHPQIFMCPVKETNYFALMDKKRDFRWLGSDEHWERLIRRSITNFNSYKALFDRVSTESAIGEVSPLYVYSPRASTHIQKIVPNAKLIAILRQPIDRAYSHFVQGVRYSWEPFNDFFQALEDEERRILVGWPGGKSPPITYVRGGLYFENMKRYCNIFKTSQIRTYLYEDFDEDPLEILRDIFRFIGVDTAVPIDTSIIYNASGMPKFRVVDDLIMKGSPKIRRALKHILPRSAVRMAVRTQHRNLKTVPSLDPSCRRRLTERYFGNDIHNLEILIGRDLSSWLE